MRQAYQAQQSTVEPGFRWIKHPAAISPVWREKPARLAALARLTGVGFLVSAVIQPTFRMSLVIFTHIGRHNAPERAAQGGEARADVPR
jgi:hypothetical protein